MVVHRDTNTQKDGWSSVSVDIMDVRLTEVEKKRSKAFLVEFSEVFSDILRLTHIVWHDIFLRILTYMCLANFTDMTSLSILE